MISKDLFLSILAMDSYNRGYNAGIADEGESDANGLGETSDGSVRIGGATVSFNLGDVAETGFEQKAQDAGFYAIAYDITDPSGIADWGGETTVISYRGTNSAPSFPLTPP